MALTNENSNWVWSDEKLSYYDQSTGWYYREDLGYFYFDENNECHYVYPAETSAINTKTTEIEEKQHHHHKKHKHKSKENKEDINTVEKEKENVQDMEKKKDSDDDISELEEGEISEDEEEEENSKQNTSLLQQPNYINNAIYYNNTFYSNMNSTGIVNSTTTTFPTEIQLAYGIEAAQGNNIINGSTEIQQQNYEDEYMRLVVKNSDLYEKGSIILIDAEGLSIGRDKSYEKRLRLPEMQVSKYHAKIYLEAEYQQVMPVSSEIQQESYSNMISMSTMNYPVEQQHFHQKKEKSHPKHEYEDLDNYSDKEENIDYHYSMYDDDNNDYDNDKHHSKNVKDKKPVETTSKIQTKTLKATDITKEKLPIESEKIIEDVNEKEKIKENRKEKESNKIEIKENSIDTVSDDHKNEKDTPKEQKQSIEKRDDEKNDSKEELNNNNSNNNNKIKEEEEEEEEEGEITDDGEYIPIEDEEKKEDKNHDKVDESFDYQDNYDNTVNLNYEPQPQYTVTYHFSIIDMGSTHGTFLNEERLSETKICSKPFPLKNGDSIKIGSTILEVHYHRPWGACKDCTITEKQKEIPLLDKNRMMNHTEGTGYDPHPVSLEEQRKYELKRLKSKYLKRPSKKTKSSHYYNIEEEEVGQESIANTYIDRAAQRRELYNTNIPYFK
ncbi:hypothetical protein BCR36DRAFT_405929 [Piromyces finnis]|uniref:FHA domain-containing protein n=1 Tax=Piromyces finnis TaxID=1754191 RepID=A0A1Y1V2K5_9FUNG|nr:hypothetical protein BCR36DRAFT_405929 [Piromyces finnis]|eukprot:ORX45804.1 hypothetical protein BCR36DRAFT_405929 [Piromyces finnis]